MQTMADKTYWCEDSSGVVTLSSNAGLSISSTSPATANFSGTYSPSLTNGATVSASSARACQYLRVGNVIKISGAFDTAVSVANTTTVIDISIPVALRLLIIV